MGQCDHSAFAAHQVIKKVADDQFTHLIVVAGGIDLHSVDKAAVTAKYWNIGIESFCQLICHLIGVCTYQDNAVSTGRNNIFNAACKFGKIIGSVDHKHFCAFSL